MNIKLNQRQIQKNIGIWVKNDNNIKKIGAIGIKVKKMGCLSWFFIKSKQ